ncbi:SRPBCC domain-containing protein [Aeromonas sp. FDAARGOS 1407]|uniref:SRPBCC domain-containing protein n=1 Tax=Aeromonas TaxID=642 RepID=UPI001C23C662|nr:SRPBCC domain-containing protein [Aeromonas sp. FDAARGOS 1407]QXC33116.1 SRPBCC domain-containing protein [Aeromonas sp. FDAARGOS 1407]
MKISVETRVEQEIEAVWWAWNDPDCVARWNAASDDWHTTSCRVDLVVGGRFCHHMAARDGSAGFDFTGTFTRIEAPNLLCYVMDDGREVEVRFTEEADMTHVHEIFDAETEHSAAVQQAGWQSILDNFKRYVEAAG